MTTFEYDQKKSEKMRWSIIRKHFDELGVPHSQIDSFNHFILVGLPTILHSEKYWFGDRYIQFRNPYIDRPYLETTSHTLVYPQEAQVRGMTYESVLYADLYIGNRNDHKVDIVPKMYLTTTPVMVMSDYCNLKGENIVKRGECEYEQGGYFIINGKERVLISQERLNYNTVYVFANKSIANTHFAQIRSSDGIRSFIFDITANENKRGFMFKFSQYPDKDFPLGCLFKALGFETQEDLVVLIGKRFLPFIRIMMKESQHVLDSAYACNWIGTYLEAKSPTSVLEDELFPHLRTKCLKVKAYFLGCMTRKLLRVMAGSRLVDNRDSFLNKRIDLPGTLLHDLFRTVYKKFLKIVFTTFTKSEGGPLVFASKIVSIITRNVIVLRKSLLYTFATGNWGVHNASHVKTGVSVLLNRLTYSSMLSHITRITAPVGKDGKMTELRQVHNSMFKIICPVETPEGKDFCGINKNSAILTKITIACSESIIEDLFTSLPPAHFPFRLIHEASLEDIRQTKIYLNGRLIGVTSDPAAFVSVCKELRAKQLIHPMVSIGYRVKDNEIILLSSGGRAAAPLFVVGKGNKLLIEQFDYNKLSFQELVTLGAIQYVDTNEDESSLVAVTLNDLVDNSFIEYDYCQLDSSMILGISASLIPFSNHNQGPRNTYQTSMGKQALGVYSTNYQKRMETTSHVLCYPQKPLAETKLGTILHTDEMPSGQCATVAILCYGGWNMEDAVIMNQSSVDRGQFRSFTFHTHVLEEKTRQDGSNETIELPPKAIRMKNKDYSKLDRTGIIEVGRKVKGNDVLVGKVLHSGNNLVDVSLFLKQDEESIVDTVMVTTNAMGYKLIKVKVRSYRIPELGDKVASRQAQKGTIGLFLRQEDMPFSASSGIVPDIIVNPSALPTRMTFAMILESVFGKQALVDGNIKDATSFQTFDLSETEKALSAGGLDRYGEDVLYNGMTGEKIKARIFMGPILYQRLKHMVKDKIHQRSTGPNQLLTRQPIEGKVKGGGLRFGKPFCQKKWAIKCLLVVVLGGNMFKFRETLVWK